LPKKNINKVVIPCT